ncbi:ABC transporter ATP-binding protein/permease [Mycoplasmopsis caviae]|uniref:ABC transporter ATP-binding protein/permease n=1 Tax=Mycoplasmopsis caviae TaxID=55603 RepID=A0A3P8KXL5_9BACT|nr:ABC transporter ATP-binding protein [Mycoplasmopsis caviae]UUD34762.1 ABC transporter ATP-binding protein/permease [Mycoplasmopsis caviae]VDR42377.1 ABC-type multidrug/protein/lipid transport system ATPase component [Mycoplasmopsis caviae]VDR42554.1 ABC-type multidrug/protein/lipid transport system ATPase component [Mycoplasmopsis caviae]
MLNIFKYMPLKIKFFAFISAFFAIIQPFLSMLNPTITKQLITLIANVQNGIEMKQVNLLFWNIITNSTNLSIVYLISMAIGFALLLMIVAFLSAFFATKTCIYGTYYLRKALFEHLLTLSRSKLEKYSVGSLLTRFSNDLSKIRDGIFIVIRGLVVSPFFVIWGLVFTTTTNLYLSIAIYITIPFLIGGAIFAIFKLFPFYRKENWILDQLNEQSKEDINAVALIKSYNLEEQRYQKYFSKNQEWFNVYSKNATFSSYAWPIINVFVLFGNVIIFALIAFLIGKKGNDNISKLIGDISQFTANLSMISMGVFNTLFTINRLFRSSVSAKRFIELMNTRSEIPYVISDNKITNGSIEFRNVNFSYPIYKKGELVDSKVALKNINLKIESGQKVGIIGKTGSGKSTLVKLLSHEYLLNEEDGKILIDSHNINEIDTANFFEKVTHVYQKPMIISGSIKKNITFSNDKFSEQEIEQAINISCADFINELDDKYSAKVDQRGKNFSGGQRQRVAIAQALIKKPKILILDDSTSALDNETDLKVRQNIRDNLKESTLIIISQKINSIKDSDQIFVLDKGELIAKDKHDNLINNCKIYQEIWKSQEEEGGQ